MTIQHPSLLDGRWQTFDLVEQLGHVGSEVERALNWRARGNEAYSAKALDRALELLEFTIADVRHRERIGELTRLREVILDYFMGENLYASSEALWRGYFRFFALAARRNSL